jgi:WD40 repeat protein
MRNAAVAIVMALLTTTTFAAARPVAKVQLPCDSPYQVLSPDGAQLAVPCKDNSLRLIDLPNGQQRTVVPAGPGVNAFVYSQDGKWLALGFLDGTVKVVSTRDGALSKGWQASQSRIDLLYFFPDAKALLVGPVDSSGQVWELAGTPTLRASLPADFGGVDAVKVSPDGRQLVFSAGDTVLRWYDTSTWQKTREYRDFLLDTFALQFSPDGKQVLAGGADSRVTVLAADSARRLRQLPAEAGSFIGSIDLLGDNKLLTLYFDDAGEKPPHVLIWDLAAGTSAPFKPDATPTCGGVVGGKLQFCTTDGKTLTVSQQD